MAHFPEIGLLRTTAWTSIGIWTACVVLAPDLGAAAIAAFVFIPAMTTGVMPLVAVGMGKTPDARSLVLGATFITGLILLAPTYIWFSPVAILLTVSALRLRRVAMPYRAT